MPKFIEQLAQQVGSQAAGGGLGAIIGMFGQKAADRRQVEMQRKLQDMQMQGQMQLTDYNQQKALEMWEKTGYGAQMTQIKKAGLNPGLLYGMGGGGGQSAAVTPGNISGGNAPVGGGELMGGIGMGIQSALTAAQIENIKANTKKIEAEIPNVAKTGENIDASTKKLIQDVESSKAQQALTEIATNIAQIDEDIKGATQNAAKAIIFTQLREATERLEILTNEKEISDATQTEKIKLIRAELAGKYIDNELKRVMKNKANAEIQQMAKQLKLAYDQLENAKDNTEIQKKLQEFQTSFGGQATGILNNLLKLIPGYGK